MVGHTGIQKLQVMKKTLILYHGDELAIQSDHFILCLCCLNELVVFFECCFYVPYIKCVVLNAATIVLLQQSDVGRV